jgi:2-iminobutanoate/2-iminopropanoate deaminase
MRAARFSVSSLALCSAMMLGACGQEREPEAGGPASASLSEVRSGTLGAYRMLGEAGDLVFVSAVTAPADETGRIPGDVESQTGAALTVLDEVLRDRGLSYETLVFTRVMIVAETGEIDSAGFTRAWQRAFGTRLRPHAPARSVVGIAALPQPGARVAIEAVAHVPGQPREETE